MNKTVNISQLQGEINYKHVKNKFEDKQFLNQMNSFDIKYEVCLTIVTKSYT